MQLSEKQKSIQGDPLYWRWFQEWWDKDYSHDNLKNHTTPNGEALSEFYDDASDFLTTFADRVWHPINFPPHDPEGNLSNLQGTIRYFQYSRSATNLPYLMGFVRNDWRPSRKVDFIDCHLPAGIAPNHSPDHTIGCIWSQTTANNYNLIGSHNKLYLLSSPREFGRSTLVNCVLGKEITHFGSIRSTHSLLACEFPEKIVLRGGRLVIKKPKVKNLDVICERNCDLSFIGRKTHKQTLRIFANTNDSRTVSLDFSEVEKTTIKIEKLIVEKQTFDGGAIKKIEILDCSLKTKLDISDRNIGEVSIRNSSLREGFDVSNSRIDNSFALSGVTSSKVSNFFKAVFRSSAEFSDFLLEDSTSRNTVLQNPDFRASEFYDDFENFDGLMYAHAANFNDTEFVGTTRFEGVLFAGVPKFHGASIHSETSFDGFREPPEFIRLKELSEERLQDYQSAYRCLRQHMENISNFSQAAEFGVLEMRAKQNRKNQRVVPKSVALATKFYGKIADYGQSFMKPLLSLFCLWGVSLIAQLTLFALFASDCVLFEKGCEVDTDTTVEALKRGSSFGIPPVTLLIKRSVEQETISTNLSFFLQLFSSLSMLVHALMASFLVFLIGLALKRRLQMR